jgi:hypothetical protein
MQASTGMPMYGNSRGWWNAEFPCYSCDFTSQRAPISTSPSSSSGTSLVGTGLPRWRRALNVLLLKVSGGYTSVGQSADIAWMRLLKVQLRAEWLSDIEMQFERHQGKQSKFVLTAPPTREVVVGWLHAS